MNRIKEKGWNDLLAEEWEKEYFKELSLFVDQEYENQKVYPKKEDLFAAFESCPFSKLRVILLGQDPYHGPGQANGLAFSVKKGIKTPPSLRNIFKELHEEFDFGIANNGDLSEWAEQGVLLLNATLSVREAQAGSHQKKGWEEFTDKVIEQISEHSENKVFILWGSYAQSKKKLIDVGKHLILESAHPSPLSAYRGFFGNMHFKKVNDYLKEIGQKEINWRIQDEASSLLEFKFPT